MTWCPSLSAEPVLGWSAKLAFGLLDERAKERSQGSLMAADECSRRVEMPGTLEKENPRMSVLDSLGRRALCHGRVPLPLAINQGRH